MQPSKRHKVSSQISYNALLASISYTVLLKESIAIATGQPGLPETVSRQVKRETVWQINIDDQIRITSIYEDFGKLVNYPAGYVARITG